MKQLIKYYIREQFEGFDLKEAFLFGINVGFMILFFIVLTLALN